LITGRNHHVAGFGVVGEAATGFPGYFLAYVGPAGGFNGILLWPAVILHAIVTALLIWASRRSKHTKT
jgi:hypothetical protein